MDDFLNQRPDNTSKSSQFRLLAVLIGVACMDMLGFAMIFPLLTFYALDLNISVQGLGFIIASFSLTQLLSAPVWGRLSDRYGRRPAILISLGASAISFIVFGFANSFGLLLVSRMIQGAGGGTTGVLHAYVADTVPVNDRTRSLGWLSAATSAGTMVGPVIGSTAAGWGHAAPGLIAAGLCVVNMMFAWFWLRESSGFGEISRTKKRRPVWHTAVLVVCHPSRIVSRLVLIYGFGMLAFSSFTAVITLYMEAQFGINAGNIGFIFLYTGFLSVILRSVMLGPIVSRFGETWTLRLGALSLMLGFLSFPFAGNFWIFMVLMALIPVGTALMFPSTTALTSRWADKSELGTTMGTAQSFAGMSRTVSPLIATVLFQQFNQAMPFVAGAGFAGLVILLSLQISDLSRKSEDERVVKGNSKIDASVTNLDEEPA